MDALTRIPLGTNLQAVDQSTTELTLCRKGKFEAYLGKLIRLLLVPLFQCLFPPFSGMLTVPCESGCNVLSSALVRSQDMT